MQLFVVEGVGCLRQEDSECKNGEGVGTQE